MPQHQRTHQLPSAPVTDADAGSVFIPSVCGVSNGTATASITGNSLCVTYNPALNFNGLTTICVKVCDNGIPSKCDTVVVPVTVTPVNDKPVIQDTSLKTTKNTIIGTCLTITDPDAGSVFTAAVCGTSNGTATVNVNGNSLCVLFSPDLEYSGPASVCVKVCDNSNPAECDSIVIPIDVTDKKVDNPFTVPQGFSPNGDGVNDFFEILGIEQYPNNYLIIYNRWGNQVYDKHGYANTWNGNYIGDFSIGKELPTATYYYILKLDETQEDSEVKKGYIYLSR